jgi:hypothetical protein
MLDTIVAGIDMSDNLPTACSVIRFLFCDCHGYKCGVGHMILNNTKRSNIDCLRTDTERIPYNDVLMKRRLAKYSARNSALRFRQCTCTQYKNTTMQFRPIIFLTTSHCISVSSDTRRNTSGKLYVGNVIVYYCESRIQVSISDKYVFCVIWVANIECWRDIHSFTLILKPNQKNYLLWILGLGHLQI